MSRSVLIGAGKGGTGTSMFAVNIAMTLAQKGFRVVLIDFNMGMRCLDLYLGLESEVVYDIGDVLCGRCKIRQGLVTSNYCENLSLMAASPEYIIDEITPLHMEVLCQKLKAQFDFVIVDAPTGIGTELKIATGGIDEAVLVATPEYSSVRDTEVLINKLDEYGVSEKRLVINKIDSELMDYGFVPEIDEIVRQLRLQILGLISYDENIHISTNMGVPIVCKNGIYIKETFDKIIESF